MTGAPSTSPTGAAMPSSTCCTMCDRAGVTPTSATTDESPTASAVTPHAKATARAARHGRPVRDRSAHAAAT